MVSELPVRTPEKAFVFPLLGMQHAAIVRTKWEQVKRHIKVPLGKKIWCLSPASAL